jgi:catechol 2,3-dioxygenase-like lactoylglutathione lyase family enzyme
VRISQLTLATADVARQSAFWSETFGLPVRDAGGGAIEVALQSSTIRFEQAEPGEEPRYHFSVSVPRGSIEAAAAWIEPRHELLAFHGDPDEEEGATIVRTDSGAPALYFLDGVGNVVELIANSPLAADAPFGAGSLLGIAEIGVATADTDATVAAIRDALSAGIHWGGREGWLLTAIGDDDGVVIVAPAGRGWIPVGLPAHPWPTTIVAAAPRHADLTLAEGPYRIRAFEA